MTFLKMCLFGFGCAEFIAVHRLSLVAGAWGGGDYSPDRLFARIVVAPLVAGRGPEGMWAQRFWCRGFVASRHVDSFWIRDHTHVSCLGRQTPDH